VAKFVFSHSKLRKQPFFANIFKIQGGQDPLPPFSMPMIETSLTFSFLYQNQYGNGSKSETVDSTSPDSRFMFWI